MRLDRWLATYIPDPKQQKKARDTVRSATNFFKHGGRQGDADKAITFVESQSLFLLLDAIEQYREMTKVEVPAFVAYRAWYFLGPGKDFVDSSKEQLFERARRIFAGATKATFFADVLRALDEQSTLPEEPR